jgi:hypothetical protein
MVTEYPENRVAYRVKCCCIDTDQCTGNIPGEGDGVYRINRIADGALPHSFLGIIPGRVGIDLFFSKNERVRDCPEIIKDRWIGFMDIVTRADDVDVFLLIHEYYPDLDDKWLSSITIPFFPKIWNQEQEKRIY